MLLPQTKRKMQVSKGKKIIRKNNYLYRDEAWFRLLPSVFSDFPANKDARKCSTRDKLSFIALFREAFGVLCAVAGSWMLSLLQRAFSQTGNW
jgi:hypothetical protein